MSLQTKYEIAKELEFGCEEFLDSLTDEEYTEWVANECAIVEEDFFPHD